METTYLVAVIIAMGSSICFAGNRAFSSRPLLTSDTSVVTYLTLLIGVLILGAALAVSGQLATLFLASLVVIIIFAIVGVVNYTISRQLSYTAVKNIGANSTSPLLATSTLYSLLFSFIFLHEVITPLLGAGTALILFGIFGLEIRSGALKRHGKYKTGYLAAISAALMIGLTPVLISYGLSIYNYFVAALFISYAFGLMAYTLTPRTPRIVRGLFKLPRKSLVFFILASIFASAAQLLRFASLSIAPVVLIAPILSMNPIFTILLTRAVAKDVEVFTLRTVASMLIVVTGSILVTLSGSRIA